MSKIEVKTEIDIQSLLAQLNIEELEEISRAVSATIIQRKTKDGLVHEAELLRRLTEECTLSNKDLNRFLALRDKREQNKISSNELAELFQLIKVEEQLRLEKIKILGNLAQIRGVSLQKLTEDLEITPLESA